MSGIKGMKHKKPMPYRKEQLEDMCQNYLRDNFHKFTEANKQKIALTIAGKMVTQKSENLTEVKYQEDAQTGQAILNHINRIDGEVNTN